MESHPMLRRFNKGFDQETQERLLAKADQLSPKGQKKLNNTLSDYHTILVRKPMEVRISMIDGFIDEIMKIYPIGCDESKNLWTESIKKRVVQVDKKTGKVVAIHESVRTAWKASGVYHGTICKCCQNMECRQKGEPYKFKGYLSSKDSYWYFETTWNEMQSSNQETKE